MSWWVLAIGAIAQILFSARTLLQWIVSERHKRVLTPALFWQLSLIASFLMFCYGYLRDDFAIMLGQIITYFIYIRNIQLQGHWSKLPWFARFFLWIFPAIILLIGYTNGIYDRERLFRNEDIATWLFILGIVSQVTFTMRFVYQWIYSEKARSSSLPAGFWILSIFGSGLILTYAIFRQDPVLLVGHLFGITLYARNLYILKTQHETHH